MIAFLGTGLLGSGFARAAKRRGDTVRVWNRTAAKARALTDEGIDVCIDAHEAIRGAARVHLVVSDDAAVDDVLAAARPEPGMLVVDHTTTSTAGARHRAEYWQARQVRYLHAPVFMGPANALSATGLMLVSGDRELVAAAMPVLAPMTGKLIDLGPRVDAAAAFKLLGNLLLMAITTGFADMLALTKAMDLPARELVTLLHHFNPGTTLPARLQRMLDASWDDPSWELAMARKDARLIEREAAAADIPLAIVPAIAQRMDDLIAEGLGHKDWTVLARDFLP